MKITIDGVEFDVKPAGDTVTVGDQTFEIKIDGEGSATTVIVDGKRFKVHRWAPPTEDGSHQINVDGRIHTVTAEGALRAAGPKKAAQPKKKAQADATAGTVTALMPGRVVSLKVEEGQEVQEGEVLLVLEAMKMENEIRAAIPGAVKSILVKQGQNVSAGDVMLEIR